MKTVEISLIVRKKLKKLRLDLTVRYGAAVSKRLVRRIIDASKGLEMFDERENFMWKLFGIDTTPQETYDYWDE